jgi:hypothetical protein
MIEPMQIPRQVMVRSLSGAVFVVLVLAADAPTARAQSSEPAAETGRYSFNKIDDGYLRLDTGTGQVALCSRRTIGWACQLVPDERVAMEGEIARLQDELARLRTELDKRPPQGVARVEPSAPPPPEKLVPPTVEKPGPPAVAERREPTLQLPSDEEIDRMMTFFEKVWRRLVDMIGSLQKEPRRS